MQIQVAVMCTDASGAPEMRRYTIELPRDHCARGEHYDAAKVKAKDEGYAPVMAFDENDPAWSSCGMDRVPATADASTEDTNPDGVLASLIPTPVADLYKKFFEEMVNLAQGAFIPGKSIDSGADILDEVGRVMNRYLRDEFPRAGQDCTLYVEFSPENGFWSEEAGFVEDIVDATFTLQSPLNLNTGWIVLGLELKEMAMIGLESFPAHSDLQSAADEVLRRGKQHEFTVGTDNAAEAMREEFRLLSFADMPATFDVVFVSIMSKAIEDDRREQGDALPVSAMRERL